MKTKTILMEKIKESVASVLPVSLIIFLLSFTICPLPNAVFISFIFSVFIMIFGMALFTLGVDKSMTPMGEHVGATMTKTKKVWIVALVSFFIGTLITASEPDLTVLAQKISAIDSQAFIWTVALGVGIFLLLAVFRIVFKIKLRYVLFISYGLVFLLAAFSSPSFLAIAFDAGGVTTGPLTVPFIMAMGVGISSISSDESDDSFGLMALCSVGPILAILVLGLIYDVGDVTQGKDALVDFLNSREFGMEFITALPHQLLEVAKGLFPVVIFFFIYQLIAGRVPKDQVLRLLIGVLYTYTGIVLFLTGANMGFLPVGQYMGETIAASPLKWILIPIGMLLGYFIVLAEPAIHVLEKQVEEVTAGSIPSRMLKFAMSIAVSIAVGLAMFRVFTGISILWFVGIGYAVALLLSFVVPEVFTSIAFDSGGVASGAMTSTFLMPLAIGATFAVGGNIMTDAFGVIAMVALLPPITVQILGLIYQIKLKIAEKEEALEAAANAGEVIELNPVFDETVEIPAHVTVEMPVYRDPQTNEEYPDIIEFTLPF
ncbi:MAG: DUF1538 domain-containing protein [Clostridia bacterium]|nr:DUF1538 domain-containing protein [Clostridia bacterium]